MPQPPRQPVTTVVGNLKAIRHQKLDDVRPDEVLVDIQCPDCLVDIRWSAITEYPDGGIACSCPNRVWSLQAVTNIPRQPKPTVANKGE